MIKVEHSQNNFLRHNEIIDTLKQDINGHEQELGKFVEEHPVASYRVHFKDHTAFRDKVESQRKLHTELKTEYLRFLTETM